MNKSLVNTEKKITKSIWSLTSVHPLNRCHFVSSIYESIHAFHAHIYDYIIEILHNKLFRFKQLFWIMNGLFFFFSLINWFSTPNFKSQYVFKWGQKNNKQPKYTYIRNCIAMPVEFNPTSLKLAKSINSCTQRAFSLYYCIHTHFGIK